MFIGFLRKKKSVDELHESTVLFDTVAVYLANPGPKPLIKLETLPIVVTKDGFTRVDPKGTENVGCDVVGEPRRLPRFAPENTAQAVERKRLCFLCYFSEKPRDADFQNNTEIDCHAVGRVGYDCLSRLERASPSISHQQKKRKKPCGGLPVKTILAPTA